MSWKVLLGRSWKQGTMAEEKRWPKQRGGTRNIKECPPSAASIRVGPDARSGGCPLRRTMSFKAQGSVMANPAISVCVARWVWQ